ncbi:MAG TPA: NAD(P)H-dependent oxidoreductase subunit E [Spirochaetia bacterium]|nr:NAD(P)H-dependent oxidoreductase subunit E [Spirochaetia bacterium]
MQDTKVKTTSTSRLDEIIARHTNMPGNLLGILEEAQEGQPHHYLPEEDLHYISDKTGIPLSQVYSVATFYSFFSLEPQGRHSFVVCRGTACHTRGSRELLEEAIRTVGLEEARGDEEGTLTTPDGFISIRTVACFGQCALAPVIMCDGVIRSSMTAGKTVALLRRLRKGAAR